MITACVVRWAKSNRWWLKTLNLIYSDQQHKQRQKPDDKESAEDLYLWELHEQSEDSM